MLTWKRTRYVREDGNIFVGNIRLLIYRRADREQNLYHRLLYASLDPAHDHQLRNHIAGRHQRKYRHHLPAFDFVFVTRTKGRPTTLATLPIYQNVLAASAQGLNNSTLDKIDDKMELGFNLTITRNKTDRRRGFMHAVYATCSQRISR